MYGINAYAIWHVYHCIDVSKHIFQVEKPAQQRQFFVIRNQVSTQSGIAIRWSDRHRTSTYTGDVFQMKSYFFEFDPVSINLDLIIFAPKKFNVTIMRPSTEI